MQNRTAEQLIEVWNTLNPEERVDFINEQCSAREAYILDSLGYLENYNKMVWRTITE